MSFSRIRDCAADNIWHIQKQNVDLSHLMGDLRPAVRASDKCRLLIMKEAGASFSSPSRHVTPIDPSLAHSPPFIMAYVVQGVYINVLL